MLNLREKDVATQKKILPINNANRISFGFTVKLGYMLDVSYLNCIKALLLGMFFSLLQNTIRNNFESIDNFPKST